MEVSLVYRDRDSLSIALPVDRQSVVCRSLVGNGKILQAANGILYVFIRSNLERIYTATAHEKDLIPEYITNRPELSLITIPIAQQTGIGIGPSVPEYREIEGYHLKPIQVILQHGRICFTLQTDANSAAARQ